MAKRSAVTKRARDAEIEAFWEDFGNNRNPDLTEISRKYGEEVDLFLIETKKKRLQKMVARMGGANAALAHNPHLSEEAERIILEHPSVDADQIRVILKRTRDQTVINQAVEGTVSACDREPDFGYSSSSECRQTLRDAVAANPHLSEAQQMRIADFGSARLTLAANRALAEAPARKILRAGQHDDRYTLARNPQAPPAVLHELYEHPASRSFRWAVVANPNIPDDLLAKIIAERDPTDWYFLTGNPRTPPAVQEDLAEQYPTYTATGGIPVDPLAAAIVTGNTTVSHVLQQPGRVLRCKTDDTLFPRLSRRAGKGQQALAERALDFGFAACPHEIVDRGWAWINGLSPAERQSAWALRVQDVLRQKGAVRSTSGHEVLL